MFGASGICTPALIYLVFSIAQITIDTVKGFFNTALVKLILTIIVTLLLNYLCSSGLGILSWIIVFIPFILMTVVVTMLLFVFNLDPKTGRLVNVEEEPDDEVRRDLILYHEHHGSHDAASDCKSCVKKAKKKKPFYRLKMDEEPTNFDSDYNSSFDMTGVRNQRLAQY